MSNLFWLSEEQFEKIKPLLPNDVRGVPRVDDRRVLSGIIHVIKRGLRWSRFMRQVFPKLRWKPAARLNGLCPDRARGDG